MMGRNPKALVESLGEARRRLPESRLSTYMASFLPVEVCKVGETAAHASLIGH